MRNVQCRGMAPQRLLTLIVGVALVATGLFLAFRNDGYDKPHHNDQNIASLLDRAIEAMGGEPKLSSIKRLETRSATLRGGVSVDTHVRFLLPNHYRHDMHMGGATVTHATDGQKAWSALDGIPVPLDDIDRSMIRKQVLFTQCGLLVAIKARKDVLVKELGIRNDLEWLEVRFEAEDASPFLLGFSQENALLKSASWSTEVPGSLTDQEVTFEFSDYRQVHGLTVAFQAAYSNGSGETAVSTIKELVVNPEFNADIFKAPDPIANNATPCTWSEREGQTILRTPQPGSDNAPLSEQELLALASDQELLGAGLIFEEILDGEVVARGLPVQKLEKLPEPPQDARWALFSHPTQPILTTIARGDLDDAIPSALTRMNQAAQAKGRKIDGPVRVVRWKEELAQIQAICAER